MSWKVLITARAMSVEVVSGKALERLAEAGIELIHARRYGPLPEDELLDQLRGIDAVLAGMDHFTARVLGSPEAAGLKLISRWGVGYDAIDLPAASAQGIIVAYTPGMLDESVADYTMALLLTMARNIPRGWLALREGRWDAAWGDDLGGKTLGLVGCGRIGRAVARRAAGFDMRVLGFDPAAPPEAAHLGITLVSLDRVLAEADYVSLHAALTPATRGLIGEAELRAMKPGACLINTARGAMLDEAALERALREKWIGGAALDVFGIEPLPPDHALHSVPNLLLTPHQASLGHSSGAKVSAAAVQAVLDCRDGRVPRWVANPDVARSPALRISPRQ
jgi:D-3-phosphoglycerate dehydrogenase / 2-oxoglutarate reductase